MKEILQKSICLNWVRFLVLLGVLWRRGWIVCLESVAGANGRKVMFKCTYVFSEEEGIAREFREVSVNLSCG